MIKRLVVGIVLLVVAALTIGFIWRDKQQGASSDALTLHGNVDIRQVSLAFDGSDRVAEMRVEEGDRVQAGQVLAVLDTRTTALQLAQATAQTRVLEQALLALRRGSRPQEIAHASAQVDAAQAEVQRSLAQLQRLQNTAQQTGGRAVSAQDLDNARSQLLVAQAQLDAVQQTQKLTKLGPREEDIARADAQLQAAKAEQALLQHRVDQAELRAPQSGIIRARLLEPGDMASPQRAAYTIALTNPKWVRAYVTEVDLGRVRQGMTANVNVDSNPGRAIPGRIGFISSVAEFTPKTVQTEELRTSLVYEVRILVDDAADTLRLGMPATVHIELSSAKQAPSGL